MQTATQPTEIVNPSIDLTPTELHWRIVENYQESHNDCVGLWTVGNALIVLSYDKDTNFDLIGDTIGDVATVDWYNQFKRVETGEDIQTFTVDDLLTDPKNNWYRNTDFAPSPKSGTQIYHPWETDWDRFGNERDGYDWGTMAFPYRHMALIWSKEDMQKNDMTETAMIEYAKSVIDEMTQINDGEVYQYDIYTVDNWHMTFEEDCVTVTTDQSDDSCSGYVGDSKYCLEQAVLVAKELLPEKTTV